MLHTKCSHNELQQVTLIAYGMIIKRKRIGELAQQYAREDCSVVTRRQVSKVRSTKYTTWIFTT